MFNYCVQQVNMTEADAASAVQMFVYALGSAPLLSDTEKADVIVSIEKKLSAPPNVDADPPTAATLSTWDEEVPSIYEDDLLREFGQRAPLVAAEIDAVLLSKPESTNFSRKLLSGFQSWVKVAPDVGLAAKFLGDDEKNFKVKLAFGEVSEIFSELWGDESRNTRSQMEVNLIGTLSFRALGNPKEELFVPDADADRFLREVVASFATETTSATAACGMRLIRFRFVDPTATAAEVSRTMKATLAETGLDEKVSAFLSVDWEPLETLSQVLYRMNQINRQTEKLEANEYVSDAEVEGALQEFAGEFSGIASDLSAAPRKYLIMLVPAKTRPQEATQLGEQGRTALALGAPITLCAFLGDAFDGPPMEIASKTVGGDAHLLTQVGFLGATMIGLLLARDAARSLAARKVGVELGKPLALPCFETGVLARRLSLASYPANAEDLFDVVLAGPSVGLLTSAAALLVGLQMTASAGPEALAGFPSLPSSLLQGSSFVGSLVDSFLHTNLAAKDLAAERIAMHPLAVGGAVAMLWNAATVLPLPGSDGKTAISTLEGDLNVAGFANFLAVVFVACQVFGGGGGFLLSVFACSFVAYPDEVPIIREDNVTPVRSPPRFFVAFLVAALSVLVLTPMTLSSFLSAGGAMSVDTGAGAESVAAGFGVGGVGFGGFL